jgi:hypothetical protein
MQIIKPTTIIVALLSIVFISCHDASKSPGQDVKASQNEYKTSTTADKEKSTTNESANKTDNAPGTNSFMNSTEDEKQQQEPVPPGDPKKQPAIVAKPANPDWEKKIIKTASVNLEVEDYNKYYASVREKVKSIGGYIAQEEQNQSDYKIENSMVIKVPVDKFDDAIGLLSGNVKKINERKITSEDVTGEVVDTKSRIEAKKQVRQRYMDLLGQARNMQDILSVQSEINGIQEEIESASGRVEYLSHASVFSTISLTYYQVLNSSAKDKEQQPNPSFGEKIKNALATGWEIVSSLIIGLITLWPLLLGSFGIYLVYKKIRTPKTKQA